MQKCKGFSLVEMLVVIFILGILAAVMSFGWNRYVMNANLRTAAGTIVTDMNLMKQNAVSNPSITYTIVFNKNSATDTFYTPTGFAVKHLSSLGTGTGLISSSSSGVVFSSFPGGVSTYTLTFLARGTLNVTNGDSIILKNSRNSTATITLNVTGKIYVTYNMH